MSLRQFFPFFEDFLEHKYVVGKIVVCMAVLLYLGSLLARDRTAPPPAAEATPPASP
jgi:hypothetical protein